MGLAQASHKATTLNLIPSQHLKNNTPKRHLSVYPLLPIKGKLYPY
jgi:hypothetical protein